ncbi:MAG: hypothetical protein ACFFDW_11070 [Candidatus Thorarchaeota archaeon]
MEKIERIVPYLYRKDGEFEPYLNFSVENIPILDPNFFFNNEILNEIREDRPYESHKKTLCYGSPEQGIEICIYEEYEPKANEKIIDRVNIKAYGLKGNHSYEIESAKIGEDPDFLEIRLIGSSDGINTIAQNFYNQFAKAPTAQKILKNQLFILQTAIKRKAWNLVEIKAQSILKDFPDSLEAKISLVIAQAALGDIDDSRKIIDDFVDYKLFREISEQKESAANEYEKTNVISLLNQVRNLEPENNSLYFIIGQLYEKIGLRDEALHIYQKTLLKIENGPEMDSANDFIDSLRSAIAKLIAE